MRYTKEERLEIGRKIYEGTIMSRYDVAEAYCIIDETASDYMRMYRDSNSLLPKSSGKIAQVAMFTAFLKPAGYLRL